MRARYATGGRPVQPARPPKRRSGRALPCGRTCFTISETYI
jgi:hypothetical protein